MYLIDELWKQLPGAKAAGMPWRRRRLCRQCRASLSGEEEPRTVRTTLNVERLPSFEMEWRLPTLRCHSCGCEQVVDRRETEAHIAEAMVVAFDAAHVKP